MTNDQRDPDLEEGPAPAREEGPPAGKRARSWRRLMVIVVTAIVLMLLVKAFAVQVYRIPSASMEDTLLTGDRVLVSKLVYHFRAIGRGDIVVFSGQGSWGSTTGTPDPAPPRNPFLRVVDDVLADAGIYSTQTYYIKRVIGLPGDHVACCTDGKMTVNGVPLDEKSYLFPGASPSAIHFSVTVPPGRLWVMGDNRAISDDSREHMAGARRTGPSRRARWSAGPSWSCGRCRSSATCRFPARSSAWPVEGSGFRGDGVVAQVLVDDAGPDVGHLGPFGQLVDDEGIETLVVGHRDVDQEILAAGDDEHPHGVREPGRPVAEGLDVAPGRRPDPDGDERLDRAADSGEVHVEQGAADHPALT